MRKCILTSEDVSPRQLSTLTWLECDAAESSDCAESHRTDWTSDINSLQIWDPSEAPAITVKLSWQVCFMVTSAHKPITESVADSSVLNGSLFDVLWRLLCILRLRCFTVVVSMTSDIDRLTDTCQVVAGFAETIDAKPFALSVNFFTECYRNYRIRKGRTRALPLWKLLT